MDTRRSRRGQGHCGLCASFASFALKSFFALRASLKGVPMAEPIRLRLFENYRFVLYAPFYGAHAIGAYADEGLEVELLPSPGPGRAEAALAAGAIDVAWMGPIRLTKHHDENAAAPPSAFAEVAWRA